MSECFKVRLTNQKAAELVVHDELYFDGENMLPTGAKLMNIGSGWWVIKGYAYDNKDTKPYQHLKGGK